MMEWTDRHCRTFMRLLSKRALLYTEMITAAALIHGDRAKLLRFNRDEHPVAIQLGGSDPAEMAVTATMAEDAGYDEININIGCPSDRVQSGRFGACLMAEPQLVADCVAAMRATVRIPVTIKTRIGIERDDSTERLYALVNACSSAGVETFIIHARNAWLNGLSPKENRELPPLRYDVVYALKRDFPSLEIIINGGIKSIAQCHTHLGQVDGVMLGREAYQHPYLLALVDQAIFAEPVDRLLTREDVIAALIPYIEREIAGGSTLHSITRHIMGLYQGMRGARAWRRVLSEKVHRPGAGVALLREALAHVTEHEGDHFDDERATVSESSDE